MPAKRTFGMDQDFYPWSPIVSRPVLRWPDNARVALAVIVNLEHWDWEVPAESGEHGAAAWSSGICSRANPTASSKLRLVPACSAAFQACGPSRSRAAVKEWRRSRSRNCSSAGACG